MPIPASRDRLHRPVDISTLLVGANRRVGIMVDEPGLQRVGLLGNGRGGGNGRGNNGQRAVVVGSRRGGGVGRRSQLPSWYPRTPLRDITAITRAIERRRAELGLNQNPEAPQEAVNVQDEPGFVPSTPVPTISVKPKPSLSASLWRMKADHAGYTADDYENLTPQKKLLESIEKVREVWLEDQRKHQRTPMAKRAEREKKVRVLMSMR